MNRSALKKYAPQARLDFIEAVTLRARRLGLDPALPVSVEQTGDVLLIAGQPFPASVAKQRAALAQRIQQQGFSAVVEALAYTWFNRLVAIRFMELKGYLSHGYRVLSHPQGQQPEILDHVQHLDLPGLDKAEVIRLKTAGNQDEALYREILLAQCNDLHRNMPFLFEALDDATELLLPDNLLRTDSPIAHLVSDIEEGDWQEVEVIGWLYQFYISDKKDEVIGKVVKSEDIPAATQLFTPNWIVQYLVQNSLGRLWLMANPGSSLKEKMPYYIEPAEQTQEVQAQLDALIKVRMDEDGGTLNPESLTVLDPACGSGHILVEAYNLLRAIYEERGYRLREIPRLILQKNLYGLDIDDRAAQLAGFALLMKAREDDRRLFDEEGNPPHLNVMAIQQSAGLPDEEIARVILNAAIEIEGGVAFHSGQLFGGGQLDTQHSSGLTVLDMRQLIQLFEHGKTFGSLISVPAVLKAKLGKIVDLLLTVRSKGDDLSRSYANQVLDQFALPASVLALQYDAVVANPPYMGSKGMNLTLKEFAKKNYSDAKADLFAMFIERGFDYCKLSGSNNLVTMQSWMFLSSYEVMREKLIADRTIITMAHLGARAFSEISGEVVQATAFVLQKTTQAGYRPVFFRLIDGVESEKRSALLAGRGKHQSIIQSDFSKVPGSPLAYWVSDGMRKTFDNKVSVKDYAETTVGMFTCDNQRFLRLWHEVPVNKVGFGLDKIEAAESGCKFFPYNKGGGHRKWYGLNQYVVSYENDGFLIREYRKAVGQSFSLPGERLYFRESITWSDITTSDFAARYSPVGALFDIKGASAFCEGDSLYYLLAFFCSKPVVDFMKLINPTSTFQVGDINKIPVIELEKSKVVELSKRCISLSKLDWDSSEISWDFASLEWLSLANSLPESWLDWARSSFDRILEVKALEEENNRIFAEAYGLIEEISCEVSEDSISLSRADREKDMRRQISYAIGCMMGRYSLDESGLIYAHSGGEGFDPSRYTKFPADSDGIIPVTDETWFEDDAAERVREFVRVVWGAETLVENMEWLADSLGRKAGESADEAIRRYLSTSFYKDHLQTYKKRPIYWLFSSGKQKAFECLVYLHRYNEGTLSRMRMEYVVPLQSRMQARIDKLTDDIDSATSSAQQKALQKRKDKLTKQLEELRRFDENLRPYADQRITLDLDDGVKVNYGKFGNLLAEVKAVTGGKEE
ncbi:BREX-1 system adenine-specific DNA-methyltransferase PglX [Stutzerimonas stutzeri]|uniref:BREX-1 system adenine-specific DNA-methyltransferase PglX n=1 Tax=Stutzerimonas stutzeri TaxID=316 RepID=UPI000F73ADCF|nr:BREX-1 system adenine-specific DNA-methyltransferase PglX [Stutzerimonas stutzeri]RRW11928.1 BREX-1 system adenine-specific DNA-methyltransferase PglX [Stutzerimonas stutzeri]